MDVARGEMVERELDAFIERRARKGEVDPDEREELWQESVRAYNARRSELLRAAWREYHQGQAERLRRTVAPLIAFHEERAAELWRGRKALSGRKDAADLRARGIAALMCRERPAFVARDLGVPEGTVRSWKYRAKNRGIATLKKGDFGTLLTTHLEALIRSLLAQSRELSGRWSEMGAGELALTFGLLFDRTLRMLELQEGVWGEGGA